MLALRLPTVAVLPLLAGSATLPAQIKVTNVAAGADIAPFYRETTWSNLNDLRRLTTPLVNLTFVTDSGFRLTQRDEADRALPASIRLAGLRTADFQEIADAVQNFFVAELMAQHVEILPYEPLAVNPGFQELAHEAGRTGKEQPVPVSFQTVAGISGGQRAMTLVGHHCPWIESFMAANFLSATRLTRDLGATLPIVSFLVEFVEYSTDRGITYDWHEFLPAGQSTDAPRLRARPQLYLSSGSAALLMPDSRTAMLTLATPIGSDQPLPATLRAARPRDRAERNGGSFEMIVDPAAYKRSVIELLKPQVTMIARRLALVRH